MLVIFWINLIKIKIVWLLKKLDLHSFWNGGKIEMLVIYSEYDGWKLKWTVLNSAGGKLMNGDSFNFKGVRRDNFRLLSFIPFFFVLRMNMRWTNRLQNWPVQTSRLPSRVERPCCVKVLATRKRCTDAQGCLNAFEIRS